MNLDEAMDLADHANPLPHLAGEALRVLRAELERQRAACHDCGCLYERFGLDLTLPHDQWAIVSAGTNGLLCASCICRRAAELPGAIAVRASIEVLAVPEPPAAQGVLRDALSASESKLAECQAATEKLPHAIAKAGALLREWEEGRG
jgi:hypothetical protein